MLFTLPIFIDFHFTPPRSLLPLRQYSSLKIPSFYSPKIIPSCDAAYERMLFREALKVKGGRGVLRYTDRDKF